MEMFVVFFSSTFKHLQETFLIGCCGKCTHAHTQMCTHKYTHARSTQTHSSRSNSVNHLLNPAFLYSSTEPNRDNCMQRWWDTCSALTFLNTWLMQVKSLGEIDFLFRAPCVSTMERQCKGTAKLGVFLSGHYLHQVALSNFPNFNE